MKKNNLAFRLALRDRVSLKIRAKVTDTVSLLQIELSPDLGFASKVSEKLSFSHFKTIISLSQQKYALQQVSRCTLNMGHHIYAEEQIHIANRKSGNSVRIRLMALRSVLVQTHELESPTIWRHFSQKNTSGNELSPKLSSDGLISIVLDRTDAL